MKTDVIVFLVFAVGLQLFLGVYLWRTKSCRVGLLECIWLISWWSLPVPEGETDEFNSRLSMARGIYVFAGIIAFGGLLVHPKFL